MALHRGQLEVLAAVRYALQLPCTRRLPLAESLCFLAQDPLPAQTLQAFDLW